MFDSKKRILKSVAKYIQKKHKQKKWKAGEDWVAYSGPNIDEKEICSAVDSLLDEWFIFGKKSQLFERVFPWYLGKTYGCFCNSGSSANLLMLAAATKHYQWKPGTKILTPVAAFPTTVAPILQTGNTPIFVDVELPSINMDLDIVEKKLKEDPEIKAIMFAPVLGNPPNMDRLMTLVKQYDLVLLEDACDSLNSAYDGKYLGSFGIMSSCSFFPAHHMSCGAEGGFVATSDPELHKLLLSMRDWGRDCWCNSTIAGDVTSMTACGSRHRNWLPGAKDVVIDHRYVFSNIGYNLKNSEVAAAIALEQLHKLKKMDDARKQNFKTMYEIFAPYSKYFHMPVATEKAEPCWFAFLLTVKDDAPFSRQDIVDYLEKAKIQTRPYFTGNILAHRGYYHLAEGIDLKAEFPVADKVMRSSFFTGTYIGLTTEKLDYIKATVDEFMKRFA